MTKEDLRRCLQVLEAESDQPQQQQQQIVRLGISKQQIAQIRQWSRGERVEPPDVR